MNFTSSIYLAVLFVLFCPGVLYKISSKQSFITIVIIHAILFAAVFCFTQGIVVKMVEGFDNSRPTCTQNKPSYSILYKDRLDIKCVDTCPKGTSLPHPNSKYGYVCGCMSSSGNVVEVLENRSVDGKVSYNVTC